SEAARDALLAEPAIREALESALSADIALVGIGSVGIGSSNVILDGLALSSDEREEFLAKNPVGDTCCRFFDANGKAIGGVVHDRVLAVELEELRRIPMVVGIATGAEKVAG